MPHAELSEAIIGMAMKVHNILKPGLNEKAYENALAIKLAKKSLPVNQQKRYDVLYDGLIVDTLVPDLIVDRRVIVDAKVVEEFTPGSFGPNDRLSHHRGSGTRSPFKFQTQRFALAQSCPPANDREISSWNLGTLSG